MTNHVGQRISVYEQAELFGHAYTTIAAMKKAISGFVSTGLWPYNPDIFCSEEFAAAVITDEPEPTHTVSSAGMYLQLTHAFLTCIEQSYNCYH